MKKEYLYFANWKMLMSFDQTLAFVSAHSEALAQLNNRSDATVILCPPHTSLYPIKKMLDGSGIALGAQDCSAHTRGSFTGEISAQDLSEIGCSYCIIGHSERRARFHETNNDIAAKLVHLIDFNISPVVCIGETIEEHQAGKTLAILEAQLAPILATLSSLGTIPRELHVVIAYEPIWSIGTGKVAQPEHLEVVFTWLRQRMQTLKTNPHWKLIYGGSVQGETIPLFKKIPQIDGFLIGGASTRFPDFKKIVD